MSGNPETLIVTISFRFQVKFAPSKFPCTVYTYCATVYLTTLLPTSETFRNRKMHSAHDISADPILRLTGKEEDEESGTCAASYYWRSDLRGTNHVP